MVSWRFPISKEKAVYIIIIIIIKKENNNNKHPSYIIYRLIVLYTAHTKKSSTVNE